MHGTKAARGLVLGCSLRSPARITTSLNGVGGRDMRSAIHTGEGTFGPARLAIRSSGRFINGHVSRATPHSPQCRLETSLAYSMSK